MSDNEGLREALTEALGEWAEMGSLDLLPEQRAPFAAIIVSFFRDFDPGAVAEALGWEQVGVYAREGAHPDFEKLPESDRLVTMFDVVSDGGVQPEYEKALVPVFAPQDLQDGDR